MGKSADSARRRMSSVVRLLRAGISPGLVVYFLYVGLFHTVLGGVFFAMRTQTQNYMCTIPAEFNIAVLPDGSSGAPGSGCPNENIMCVKRPCWKYALNFTYKQGVLKGDTGFLDSFKAASLDSACNVIVRTSANPMDTLVRAAADPATSIGCVRFHCLVLYNTYNPGSIPELLSYPSKSATCPNIGGYKQKSEEADKCLCDDMFFTSNEASIFSALCMKLNLDFNDAYVRWNLRYRISCFGNALAAQKLKLSLLQDYQTFTQNGNCTASLDFRSPSLTPTVHAWIVQVKSLGWGTASSLPGACANVMCNAFLDTLPSSTNSQARCDWASGSQDFNITRADVDDIAQVCAAVLTNPLRTAAELTSQILKDLCGAGSASSGLALCGGASIRRLPQTLQLEPQLQLLRPTSSAVAVEAAGVPSVAGAMRSATAIAADGLLGDELGSDADLPEQEVVSERALQAAAPVNANLNDQLQDWTVGDWGKCTCYQACIEGMQTRSVACPAGVQCKEPKPGAVQGCVCDHCAKCASDEQLLFSGILCVTQGSIELLLFLGFVSVSSLEEDDWSDVGCGTKLIGCFCKFFPGLSRLLTFANVFLVLSFVFQAYVPLDMVSNCKMFLFQALSILYLVGWTLLCALGIWMARVKPMPPWLHTQSTNRMVRLLCKPISALGP
eukprot:TRINITY_DN2156_c0_g1_i3.p1 TRINITY_DN2156_c0_g1~~TRINITY_DN2156_c0_g1_i3.p1  ORF type:complete len:670 (-),score=107.68 TRINITY_DN2156_c0_g1_i3:71-2080(-)